MSAEKTARLREVMRKDLSAMSNDIFVNASLALMAKSAQDVQEANKEGNTENEERARNMISILQKILQVCLLLGNVLWDLCGVLLGISDKCIPHV